MGNRKGTKRHHQMSIFFLIPWLMLIGGTSSSSWAAEARYPTRPIQLIVPNAPGGGADLGYRPFVEKLPEYLKQPVVVVYKPGAGATLGTSFVAHSKPDGYTIIGSGAGGVILGPLSEEGVDYALDDFAPICRLGLSPTVIAVRADSPFKTPRDIVEEAKKRPGKLIYGSSGVFSSSHVLMEGFNTSAGITMTHVPMESVGVSMTALLGGHVDIICGSVSTVVPQMKAGTVRTIAFFNEERVKAFPDIPTVTEVGYACAFIVSYGFLAPKKTPQEVITTFSAATQKMIAEQKKFFEDRLGQMLNVLSYLGPEDYDKELRKGRDNAKKIVDALKKGTQPKSK
jgi:tripartite-type tricarboxylate transporter receptor subunit TctC